MIDQMSDLLVTRRLMLTAEKLKARSEGKDVKIQTAEEAMEEDQLLLSGEAPATQSLGVNKPPEPVEAAQINLGELGQKLKNLQDHPETVPQLASANNHFLMAYQRSETEVTIRYRSLEPVEGLVLRSQNRAETDRYQFDFSDGATFKITDKWTSKFTTIWGDPHVDTSDQEGDRNGEFSDLKTSNSHTTMMLEDGTRVTFTALDNGIIEQVDIFKGSQHLQGIGGASKNWNDKNSLFSSPVDTQAAVFSSSIAMGDTVYAGGDGADWYDSAGRLVWGKTTGAHVSSRPSSVLEMEIKQQTVQLVAQG